MLHLHLHVIWNKMGNLDCTLSLAKCYTTKCINSEYCFFIWYYRHQNNIMNQNGKFVNDSFNLSNKNFDSIHFCLFL
jgi:hypothetical protein